MPDIESNLTRWLSAGVIDSAIAARIRAYESDQKKPTGMRWYGIVALTLGAVLLACGVVLFVNAHWEDMSPSARFVLVIAMVSVFHLGGAMARASFRALSTTLHALGRSNRPNQRPTAPPRPRPEKHRWHMATSQLSVAVTPGCFIRDRENMGAPFMSQLHRDMGGIARCSIRNNP